MRVTNNAIQTTAKHPLLETSLGDAGSCSNYHDPFVVQLLPSPLAPIFTNSSLHHLPGVTLGDKSFSLLLLTQNGSHNFPNNIAKEFLLPKLGHRHFIVDVFTPLSLEASQAVSTRLKAEPHLTHTPQSELKSCVRVTSRALLTSPRTYLRHPGRGM
mmetsp:Transcript_40241/g.106769  ORF Transcript_40241/g.106769 Transcript_40241/m.106769 type:complete len:157 (+) Transcript_40241:471-941(+)